MNNCFNHQKLAGAIAWSGVKQSEIAARMGLHNDTISSWMTGASRPGPDKLIVLLRIIGWSDEQLKNEKLVNWYAHELLASPLQAPR